jgi:hypothetical protein
LRIKQARILLKVFCEEQLFYTLSHCLSLPMSELEKEETIPEEEENKDTEDISNEEPKE